MVAKRGRGARAQANKTKAAADTTAEVEVDAASEAVEVPEENNGDSQPQEPIDETPTETADEPQAVGESQDSAAEASEQAAEEKKEEVESGKLLVENLPSKYLFDYHDKLKELFSKHGEVTNVKRGPINVTELTTTPTLSAIVEFKNKDSMKKALSEDGTIVEEHKISVTVESRADSSVLVGVPHEASIEYVRMLFTECGEITQVQEFSKSKYKTLRVTFLVRESVEKALRLDRDLRLNGFLVTVTRYRDDDEHRQQQAHNNNKNKRQHPAQPRSGPATPAQPTPGAQGGAGGGGGGGGGGHVTQRSNNYRGRGSYNIRLDFRGSRGRGFVARGGAFPRGGFAGGMTPNYMPPAAYMGRPSFMNDGQRPIKRPRQM